MENSLVSASGLLKASVVDRNAQVIVWFRHDLRLSDNPALAKAVESGNPVLPLYIEDPAGEGDWPDGGATRWWLHHSLAALDEALQKLGSRLVIRSGDARSVLEELCESEKVVEVYWNRRYEPAIVARDTEIKKSLAARGALARSFNGSLLQSPLQLKNKSGAPYRVFTPFWKHLRAMPRRASSPTPRAIPSPRSWPKSDALASLNLLPKLDWAAAFPENWKPGEAGASSALESFAKRVGDYSKNRDLPAIEGVSRLSPHLRFGELSPIQIWERLEGGDSEPYLRQLGWREFSYHLLFHFPDTPLEPLRPEFASFPWKRSAKALEAWQKGRTGYPIVDAGMRELWATGWMHNRVRMIVASFLVKHLLVPWQEGAKWFWDTLVDADLANNTQGWQWTAGCGADAAPYFRIFNPITQGQRFDPNGEYTRRWVPELKKLPDALLFCPWEASAEELERAGVSLGGDYPKPIVDHAAGREGALSAYQKMKESS